MARKVAFLMVLSMLLVSLLLGTGAWILPVNRYEAVDGFRGCDCQGLATAETLLLGGLILGAAAAALALYAGHSAPGRRRALLGLCLAISLIHAGRIPAWLRARSWARSNCEGTCTRPNGRRSSAMLSLANVSSPTSHPLGVSARIQGY